MPNIVVVILGDRQDVATSRAQNMKTAASITFSDIVNECRLFHWRIRAGTDGPEHQAEFGITIPENATLFAVQLFARRPSGRIKISQPIQWY
jgi:hypothetical protein